MNTGKYLAESVRYLRFTNLSTTVDAMIHIHGHHADGSGATDTNAYLSLPANTSMMIFGNTDTSSPGSVKTGVLESFMVTTSGAGAAVDLEDIEIINALAPSDIQIETIVAAV
jgi:hypothetical protein